MTNESEALSGKTTERSYAYDNASNRSEMTILKNGETEKTTYTYDNNNRLLREISMNTTTGTEKLSSYTYDANGNQLMKIGGTINIAKAGITASVGIFLLGTDERNDGNYSHLASELKGTTTPTSQSGEMKIGISMVGNETELNLDYGTEISTYDVFNRLVKVEKLGTRAQYKYKADGLRISKDVNGVATKHVWDGSNIVADVDNTGAVTDLYVRGVNLISSEVNGYYLYNGHGDVVNLSDGSKNVSKTYVYDAFGVEEDVDKGDGNPFRYCGEYFDLSSGTYYLRNRYYQPTTGRFLTEDTHWNVGNMIYGDNPVKINEHMYNEDDPLGLKIYAPDITAIMQSGNLYGYGLNNPVAYIDPDGKLVISLIVAGVFIGGVIGLGTEVYSQHKGGATWETLDKSDLAVSTLSHLTLSRIARKPSTASFLNRKI